MNYSLKLYLNSKDVMIFLVLGEKYLKSFAYKKAFIVFEDLHRKSEW